jgi:hypothetical protein
MRATRHPSRGPPAAADAVAGADPPAAAGGVVGAGGGVPGGGVGAPGGGTAGLAPMTGSSTRSSTRVERGTSLGPSPWAGEYIARASSGRFGCVRFGCVRFGCVRFGCVLLFSDRMPRQVKMNLAKVKGR